MSDHYGWRIYEPDGVTVRSDDNVIMSKRLGSYTMTPSVNDYSVITIPVDFKGGIPFAWVVPTPGLPRRPGFIYIYNPPNVRCTSNSVIISFNLRIVSFPDDVNVSVLFGAVTVHWGVYFADKEQGGIYT